MAIDLAIKEWKEVKTLFAHVSTSMHKALILKCGQSWTSRKRSVNPRAKTQDSNNKKDGDQHQKKQRQPAKPAAKARKLPQRPR